MKTERIVRNASHRQRRKAVSLEDVEVEAPPTHTMAVARAQQVVAQIVLRLLRKRGAIEAVSAAAARVTPKPRAA